MWFRRQRRQVGNAINQTYDSVVTQPMAQMTAMQKLTSKVRALLLVYVVFVVGCGALYAYFETKSLWDGIWWASVTATSVGYGDQYPVGVPGRLIGIFLMSVSILLVVPIITSRFAAQLIVDSDAFTHLEQEELKNCIKELMVESDELRGDLKKLMARMNCEDGELTITPVST